MRRAGRQADKPGKKIPDNGTYKAGEYEFWTYEHLLFVDDASRDGLCDLGRKKRANQIERTGGDNRRLRLQRTRGNGGCHGVRRVMKSVRKIENQRRRDDQNHDDQCCDVHGFS